MRWRLLVNFTAMRSCWTIWPDARRSVSCSSRWSSRRPPPRSRRCPARGRRPPRCWPPPHRRPVEASPTLVSQGHFKQ